MADDYFNGFGGGDALREALRLAMAPNRLADGQIATQDFAPQPQPRDEHGFLFSRVGGGLKFNPYEAVKSFMGYRAPPGALSTSGDDAPIRNAADVAGWVGMSGLGLNAFGAVPANALGSAGAKAPQALAEALRSSAPRVENPIRAYHGSPHDFDKFDLSKIGTGEGAQAYGHGLYFAENEGVAKSYRDALGGQKLKDGTPFNERDPAHWAADAMQQAGGDRAKAVEIIAKSMTPDMKMYEGGQWQRLLRAKTMLEQGATVPEMSGRMYEVGIHASPDQFLDWDKPLSQQSDRVRQALAPHYQGRSADEFAQIQSAYERARVANNERPTPETIKHLGDAAAALAEARPRDRLTGQQIYGAHGSKGLQELGIPGIEYLDHGSRGAGQGTKNRVVFNPELIEILRKYGLLGPVAAGATANALMGDKNDQ